jgi:hypothetical protein
MLSQHAYRKSIRRPELGRVSFVVLDQQLAEPPQTDLND